VTNAVTLEVAVEITTDNIPIVKVDGEIDLHTCAPLRQTLRDLADAQNPDIIIDLTNTPYLDSAALGVLIGAIRRVQETDGTISLVGATSFVRRIFEITRLSKIFQMHDDMPAALADVRAHKAARASA